MGHNFVLVLVLGFGFQIHFYFYKWVFSIFVCFCSSFIFETQFLCEFLAVLELTP